MTTRCAMANRHGGTRCRRPATGVPLAPGVCVCQAHLGWALLELFPPDLPATRWTVTWPGGTVHAAQLGRFGGRTAIAVWTDDPEQVITWTAGDPVDVPG